MNGQTLGFSFRLKCGSDYAPKSTLLLWKVLKKRNVFWLSLQCIMCLNKDTKRTREGLENRNQNRAGKRLLFPSDHIYAHTLQAKSKQPHVDITQTWTDIRNCLSSSKQTGNSVYTGEDGSFSCCSARAAGSHAWVEDGFLNCICFTWHREQERRAGWGRVCVSGPLPVDSSAGYRWTVRPL